MVVLPFNMGFLSCCDFAHAAKRYKKFATTNYWLKGKGNERLPHFFTLLFFPPLCSTHFLFSILPFPFFSLSAVASSSLYFSPHFLTHLLQDTSTSASLFLLCELNDSSLFVSEINNFDRGSPAADGRR